MSGEVRACAHCATQNPASARFCMSCGQAMAQACPVCDNDLFPGARFCSNCGHQVDPSAKPEPGTVPAQAVTQGLANQLRERRSEGERRTITILFCDVADSTKTAEHLDPEVWAEVMAAAIDRMVEPVERYGGTVARLMGDAILAYFGAPHAHEDDPQRCLLAAVEIREACKELAADVRQRHGLDIDVRIGVNTGLVVVGDMGSETNSEYAALGDAANVAARMEQTADRGTIRVTEATRRRAGPFFEFEPVGLVEVKGRTEPVQAWVVGAMLAEPGQVRGIDGVTAPLVGREEQLTTLVGLAGSLLDGRGGAVSLLAEAGLGKSRLASEFAATTIDADLDWATGRCHSYQDRTPYAPIRAAVTDLLGLAHLPNDEDRAATVTDVAKDLDLVPDAGSYLGWLLGLPLDDVGASLVAGMDPPTLRGRVFGAIIDLFEKTSQQRPLVIVLDDLHWADSASLDFVQALLPSVERVPLLLVLLLRPRRDEPSWNVHEATHRLVPQHATTIELRPLDEARTRDLVAELLRVEGLSTAVRDLIMQKAEGNPFFVEEVVRALMDDGTIVREGERFVATRDLDDMEVPETLSDVLLARLDALEPETRRSVQIASVIGREFSAEMLRDLSGANGAFDQQMSELLRREIVTDVRARPDRILGFNHALMRDAAYGTLLLSTRRELHADIGRHLEAHDGALVQEIARHYVEAGDLAAAVPHLVAAGQQALQSYAGVQAIDAFTQAIEHWDPEHDEGVLRAAHEGLSSAHMFQGAMDQAKATLDRMLERARDLGNAEMETSALNKLGMVSMLGFGAYDEARTHLDDARANAEAHGDDEGLSEFYVGYCYLNTALGMLDVAEENMGEAAEVCFTLDPFHRNFGLTHYAHTLVLQMRFDEAEVAADRALKQAEADGDRQHLAEIKDTLAWLALVKGDVATALDLSGRARAEARAIGSPYSLLYPAWTTSDIQRTMGRHDEAVAGYEEILAVGGQVGHFAAVAIGHLGLARCRLLTHGPGDPEVRSRVEQAKEVIDLPFGISAVNHIHGEAALILLADGSLDDVDEHLEAGRMRRGATIKLSQPELLLCSAGLALGRGERDKALGLFTEAVDFIDDHGLTWLQPRARLAEAAIAAQHDDLEAMATSLAKADQLATAMGLLETLLMVREAGVGLHRALGDQQGAAAQGQALRDVLGQIAEHVGDDQTRSALLASRDHVLAAPA